MTTSCPCHIKEKTNLLAYGDCCEPFHLGKTLPESPEQLMRSRYSAYFLGLGQYIFDTHHRGYRGNASVEDFEQSAKSTHWCGLEVVRAEQEGDSGVVEFKAYFLDKDKLHCLHEASNFVREDGRWLYTDGEFKPKQVVKVSRNDPCPCGSGKKAKKCCLAN
ncbi:YchJ family protein [Kangiella sp. M94]